MSADNSNNAPAQSNVISMNPPKSTEDHSWAGVPNIEKDQALCVFFLDFFLGAFGVMISACMDKSGFNGIVFFVGILQLLSCFIFVGGIWALISGILCLTYYK